MRVRWTHPSHYRLPVVYQRNTALDAAADDPSTLNSFGQPVGNWQPIASTRARIQTLDGTEAETNNKHFGDATHRVTHPYISGLRVRDRILFEGRVLAILHINDVENLHREQRVLCVEQVT